MKRILLVLLALLGTFTLASCKAEKEVTVDSLVIVTQATETEYVLGDTLDLSGLEIKAIMSNGTEVVLTNEDFDITGFDSTQVGQKTITIIYGGEYVTFQVTVFDPEAEKELLYIEILSLPDQQQYLVDEEFDPTGLVVQAVYNTGEKEIVTDYTLSGFNNAGLTDFGIISVIWGGQIATFEYKIRAITAQGVTDTTITVGNAAATSGFFAAVGVPFNAGIEAYFYKINQAGGINGRVINFVHYDDGFFDANVGLNYTKQLVEEDKIFALVGHFGTPTVGATLGYIQEVGVPMVYAATGINALYFQESLGNPVMAVQPIYMTDGRVVTARVLNESLFGANGDAKLGATDKVGVLYTPDDVGNSIKAGIEVQALTEGKEANFVYKSFTAADTAALNLAVLDLIAAGVKTIIVASNQLPFKAAVAALHNNGLEVPVFTSYVNADATSVDPLVEYGFAMYANAWLDIVDTTTTSGFSAEFDTFAADMIAAGYEDFAGNAYAMAGYIAAAVFVEGLQRVGSDELTWESYIKAMESAPITIPMGGVVDYADGKRWGIASMSLLQLDLSLGYPAWNKVRDIETITEIVAK
ncbi:MAG: ABC transporter substrate-binding protein [Bacilli bacterium]|nr:ABC transporter substrate-binding protein [Bacilli bacterium]